MMSSNMTKTAESSIVADRTPSDSRDPEKTVRPQGKMLLFCLSIDTLQAPETKDVKRSITGWRWCLVVAGVLSSALLFSLDNSIVADVQPKIVGTFGDVEKLPWLSVAFTLGSAATTLIWSGTLTWK